MAPASVIHTTIMGNVGTTLHGQLRGRSIYMAVSQQRVKIAAVGYQTYPDVVVSPRPLQVDANHADTITDAVVIAEILSPSTANYDRNAKFTAYKQLLSLRHYLLISQTPFDVEHHFLDNNGIWQSETFAVAAAVVRLSAIDCQLSLDEIYEDVELN